jgi:hypothetical protein
MTKLVTKHTKAVEPSGGRGIYQPSRAMLRLSFVSPPKLVNATFYRMRGVKENPIATVPTYAMELSVFCRRRACDTVYQIAKPLLGLLMAVTGVHAVAAL